MTNPLIEVQKYGQSIWYDNIRRGLITSGELQAMDFAVLAERGRRVLRVHLGPDTVAGVAKLRTLVQAAL
jgi:hypothetical protein